MVKAPNFSLKDKDNNTFKLSDINSNYTIVYFYPRDNTPGCTIEAHEFSKNKSAFDKLNTTIIGISGGDEKSKTKFCEKNKLKITLLSDPDFKISKKYKVYGEKKFMGRTFMGINRVTFILDKNKKIIKKYEKVKPLSHAKDILEYLQSLWCDKYEWIHK